MLVPTILSIFFVGAEPVLTTPLPKVATPGAERVEITKKDLFEVKNWDGTQVDVLGFHLGMTRQEANVIAHRNGLNLLIADVRGSATCSGEKCEVCDAKVICPGIILDFSQDHVVGVEVSRIPEYGALVVRRAAITKQFKSKTSLLFNHYSNDLRLKLLGHEDSRELPSDKNPLYQGMVTYKYLRLGVKVFVSPNPHGPESTADLVVTFVAPAPQTQN
jgi:hypothetical protein